MLLRKIAGRIYRTLIPKKTYVSYPYPISVRKRDMQTEVLPSDGGVDTFEQESAHSINKARLEHLNSLKLSLDGKRVLDIGCGVGHLAQYFVQRGCDVVSIDAREENIAELRRRYPHLTAFVADVESQPLMDFGAFDIVFCYGLLYHLENPMAMLRNIASIKPSLLLLETMVCDSASPVLRLDDETKVYSQALRGLGCRPSPSYVVAAIDRIGFSFVYGPKRQPRYPDFRFRWKNNLDINKKGHPLRCVFVVSNTQLRNRNLVNLLPK